MAMKQEPRLTADDPRFQRKLDDQIRRLRQMLVLMAPEIGCSALGAMGKGFAETRLDDGPPELNDRRH
jgi:hypothetical protein